MTSRRPVLVALFAALCACEPSSAPANGDPPEPEIVCAATRGGDGGSPGIVQITAGAIDQRRVADVVVATAGDGGHGGHGELAPDGMDGVAGAGEATLDVAIADDYVFDASGIEPTARIEIVASGQSVVTLADTADPPRVVVQELVIRSGATLGLSCDVRIVAAHVLVEPGATLTLRSRDQGTCTLAIGNVEVDPGQRGGIATIEAQKLELLGTIDLSGSDGAPGAPGGAGGGLTVIAEEVVLGDTAVIDVSGGAGGDGVDEGEC